MQILARTQYLQLQLNCSNRMSAYRPYSNPLARREPPPGGRRPEGKGANLDRHLVPYHVKQGESSLVSSLYIYIYASTAVLFATACEGWVLVSSFCIIFLTTFFNLREKKAFHPILLVEKVSF